MPDVTVEIEVWCACGEGLCLQSSGGYTRVTVEPCEKCIDTARSEGFDDGFDQGREEGYEQGQQDAAEE